MGGRSGGITGAKRAFGGNHLEYIAVNYTDHEYSDIPYSLFAAYLTANSLKSDILHKDRFHFNRSRGSVRMDHTVVCKTSFVSP